MRTLVIAPQPFFSPRGTPFSVYYRTLTMAQQGVDIDLLTYGRGQDVDIPGVEIIRIPRFALLGDVKVGPSPLKAFLDFFILLWAIYLLSTRRYDFVHAHEEAVFIALLLKPLFRFKLVYDMHSSLPQQLDNFAFKGRSLFVKLFERLEELSLRKSDAVITICPALADYAVPLVRDPSRHFLIENSLFDPVRLAGEPQRAPVAVATRPSGASTLFASRVSRSRGCSIVYAGTLEAYQGIDMLLEAFAIVHGQCPQARLVVVGGQPAQIEALQALARRLGVLEAVTFTGQLSPQAAAAHLTTARVLVSPRRAGTNTPLKIYQQLASGKPLVATSIFSHTQVLDEQVAFLVDPNPSALAEGLIRALTNEQEADAKSARALALYRKKYSKEAYSQRIARLLAAIDDEMPKDARPNRGAWPQ